MQKQPLEYQASGIENETLAKIHTLLQNPDNQIDTIKWINTDGVINFVPYKLQNDEKGFGSFHLSEEDFDKLQEQYPHIVFTKIIVSREEHQAPKPIKKQRKPQSLLTQKDIEGLAEIGIPEIQSAIIEKVLHHLAKANAKRGYLNAATLSRHQNAIKAAIRIAITTYKNKLKKHNH